MKRLALLGLALLVALPCGRAEEDRPAVTKGELVALKARFAKVKAREDLWRKEIEKELKDAEALKIEKMRVESRPRLLAYLRCVMMLEEDLELLATPVDKIEEVRTPELSAQEHRRVAELRQKIRDRARKGGLVGGSYLRSANLGVVLDVSGSMTSYIEKLKKEIAATFEGVRSTVAGSAGTPWVNSSVAEGRSRDRTPSGWLRSSSWSIASTRSTGSVICAMPSTTLACAVCDFSSCAEKRPSTSSRWRIGRTGV
jgi:hypothetical protein